VYRLGLHVDPGPLLGLACELYVKQLVRVDFFSFFSLHAGDKSHGLFSVSNRHPDLQFLSACVLCSDADVQTATSEFDLCCSLHTVG
jgi:hypothetical protein